MDSVVTSIISVLINQGLSGIIIIVLLYAVNYLQRSNEKLQDQRVNELRTLMEILAKNTEAINSIISVIKGCPK
jgi:hypothetical protein